MAVADLYFTGFESGDLGQFTVSAGSPTVQGTTKRTGSYALQINPTAGEQAAYLNQLGANGKRSDVTFAGETFLTFYLRVGSMPGGTINVLRITNAVNTSVLRVQLSAAGALTLEGTSTSGSAGTLSTGTWYRIDVRVTSSGTSGLRLDEGTEVTVTADSGNVTRFHFGNLGTADTWNAYYEDIVLGTTAWPDNEAPGVLAAVPIGAGNYSGWTNGTGSTFAEVDERPPDDATSYLQNTSGTNAAHTFAMQTAATIGVTGTIKAVMGAAIMGETLNASTQGGVRIRSGSTDSDSTSGDVGFIGAFGAIEKLLLTDPADSGAWDSTRFDGLEAGPYKGADNSGLWCTAVYLYVLESVAGPPPAITGTGAITLPFLGVSGTGALQPEGTGSITLPFLDVSATGTNAQEFTGTGAITLPFLEVSGAGLVALNASGTGGITLPFLQVSGTGAGASAISGSGAWTLPFLQVAGAGELGMGGTASITLPFLSVDGRGLVRRRSAPGGRGGAHVYNVGGTHVLTVPAFAWETTRRLNQVGEWTARIPVTALMGNEALTTNITSGWMVDLLQDGNYAYDRPDLPYFCYRGVVEDVNYPLDESGVAICELSGSFRGIALANRVTPTSATYDAPMDAVCDDIEDGLMGGLLYPVNASRNIEIAFNNSGGNGVIPRYMRLMRVAEMARWALRETWNQDRPQFIPIDAAPALNYTFLNQEAAGPRAHESGRSGFGLIKGTPSVRREGRGIVNRIISFGADRQEQVDLDAEAAVNLAEQRFDMERKAGVAPTITMADQPAAGTTLTIEGVDYIFDDTEEPYQLSFGTGYIHIPRGANVTETQQWFVTVVNEGWDGDDPDFTAPAHPTVQVSNFVDDVANLGFRLVEREDNVLETYGTFETGGNSIEGGTGEDVVTETVSRPLTLEFATKTVPYTPQEGVNDDGSTYWYLEDSASIATYGLREATMHRTDIKAADATSGARAEAANVLYLVTYAELLRSKSPKVLIDVEVANGHDIWALPGDAVQVNYTGRVVMNGSSVTWLSLSDWWLVVERKDAVGDGGIRDVKFTLAAPEVDIEIPELKQELGLTDEEGNVLTPDGTGSVSEGGGEGTENVNPPPDLVTPDVVAPTVTPITIPDFVPPILTGAGIPNGPGNGPIGGHGGGSVFPGCCEDPTTTTTGIGDPGGGDDDDDPLRWTSFFDFLNPEGPVVLPMNAVDIVGIYTYSGGSVSGSAPSGTSVNVTHLEDVSGTTVWDQGGDAPLVETYTFYLVVPTEEGATWEASGETVFQGRLYANKDIPNGVVVEESGVDVEQRSFLFETEDSFYSYSLSAEVELTASGPLEAAVVFQARGSNAATTISEATYVLNGRDRPGLFGTETFRGKAQGPSGGVVATHTAARSSPYDPLPGPFVPYSNYDYQLAAGFVVVLNPEDE